VNLPNSLTIARIFLVPLLLVVLLTNTKLPSWSPFGVSKEMMGAVIFAVASLTDWADGYLARRRKQVTGFGQWMDPLADKLLVTAALVSLGSMGLVPAWLIAVILGREFVVTVLRAVAHARGQVLPSSRLGKYKMVAQVVAIFMLMLSHDAAKGVYVVGITALGIATLAALGSAVEYWRSFNSVMAVRPAPRDAEARRDRFSA
jgi:CDP-diacylglycerol--glycerol-3-phosphate 3-phosphatidyltransferase